MDRKSLSPPMRNAVRQLCVPEALHEVVVDHAHGLHKGNLIDLSAGVPKRHMNRAWYRKPIYILSVYE